MWPATWLARARFRGERARALIAGCAGHSLLPLDKMFTAALGLMFTLAGHVEEWPVAAGGSASISRALALFGLLVWHVSAERADKQLSQVSQKVGDV